MKVAIIGVGSFVFGPSALWDAIVEHRLAGVELALVDLSRDMVAAIAAATRRLAADQDVPVTVSEHTTLGSALDGADFVICSAAKELFNRFRTDCEIIDDLYPTHVITEFGGVAGISYTLRQIELMRGICEQIRDRCPNAWLLNTANPLPRVCQAAQMLGVRTAGFCMASLSVYGFISKLLHGRSLTWPFEPLVDELTIEAAGVNHLTFALSIRDRNGQDVLAQLRERVAAGQTAGWPISEQLLLETGHLPMPGDSHIIDFLPPTHGQRGRHDPGHGTPAERAARIALLHAIARGEARFESLLEHRSWEKPFDFIAGLHGKAVAMRAMNLVNAGQLPDVPPGVFVETPVQLDGTSVQLPRILLPRTVLQLVKHTAEQNDRIVQAAMHRDRARLRDAVEADPTIDDPAAGWRAMERCLVAHADILHDWQ